MRNNQPVTGREYQFPHGKTVISYTNLKGQITRANDAFIDLSGFTQAELMGQPHNLVRHPDMPTEAFRDMWDTLKKWGIQLSAVMLELCNGIKNSASSIRRAPRRGRLPTQLRRI
ncbi:MAG: PAS domain-containing protein [Ferrovum myxofaciens]